MLVAFIRWFSVSEGLNSSQSAFIKRTLEWLLPIANEAPGCMCAGTEGTSSFYSITLTDPSLLPGVPPVASSLTPNKSSLPVSRLQ